MVLDLHLLVVRRSHLIFVAASSVRLSLGVCGSKQKVNEILRPTSKAYFLLLVIEYAVNICAGSTNTSLNPLSICSSFLSQG